MKKISIAAAAFAVALQCPAEPRKALPEIPVQAIVEIVPLAAEAFRIQKRSFEREEAHRAELARRGIAEVPPCGTMKYTMDAGPFSGLTFDEWGEFYIDRRFVTDEEMEVVHAIEAWIRKWFPAQTAKAAKGRKKSGGSGLPVFRGFEDERYQKHDALIAAITAEFNAGKAAWCGGTAAQAARITPLSPALVKAHMIEESGGNGPASKAAWEKDPLQVNVPGDWGEEKKDVGLKKPAKRNEGDVAGNIRAAVKYLSRKGFGVSGRPAAARPSGFFDGWKTALRRYNGRRDRTETDRYYSDEYADKIVKRASDPDLFVPIEIKLAKKPGAKSAPAKTGAGK